ncbi:YwqJ-related putative deaminase [Streptomyces boncukensis]|uniref:YwqJ-like deaminase n=1 Tax=Streptomyces boncukensis TaxID=2711219 RepID=A0A6G4WZ66_9ACTN|nr:YwqJ-related putative deaminase [Streptomyces boncukensis]NGO70589.1 hypothetical protein [Streptomyces boncukensis]
MHTAQQAHAPHGAHAQHDPRLSWTAADDTAAGAAPVLRQRRDSILPAVAAALSIRGQTLTCTGSRGDRDPQLHPLVQDFLATLTTDRRVRQTGRCPEAVLLSRYLTATEAARGARGGRRTARKPAKAAAKGGGKPPKPLTLSEAKRALKHAKLTTRRIREDGDPLHDSYAPPCRSCAELLAHFGVRAVDPASQESAK